MLASMKRQATYIHTYVHTYVHTACKQGSTTLYSNSTGTVEVAVCSTLVTLLPNSTALLTSITFITLPHLHPFHLPTPSLPTYVSPSLSLPLPIPSPAPPTWYSRTAEPEEMVVS